MKPVIFRTNTLVVFLLLATSCFSQQKNVLNHEGEKYSSEKNFLNKGPVIELKQIVIYGEPLAVDEEYFYALSILVKDTARAKQKMLIDIAEDTSILTCSFSIYTAWNADNPVAIDNGSIKIVSWQPNAIKLDIDLKVPDEKYFYHGVRVFVPNGNSAAKLLSELPGINQ